jgi:hypothetical protein
MLDISTPFCILHIGVNNPLFLVSRTKFMPRVRVNNPLFLVPRTKFMPRVR